MAKGIGGYDVKGKITDDGEGQYHVEGYDSAEPRNRTTLSFGARDTTWAKDYEEGEHKSPKNDEIFYSNLIEYLGQHAASGSIVLLHAYSTEYGPLIDVEVQFDRRPRA